MYEWGGDEGGFDNQALESGVISVLREGLWQVSMDKSNRPLDLSLGLGETVSAGNGNLLEPWKRRKGPGKRAFKGDDVSFTFVSMHTEDTSILHV